MVRHRSGSTYLGPLRRKPCTSYIAHTPPRPYQRVNPQLNVVNAVHRPSRMAPRRAGARTNANSAKASTSLRTNNAAETEQHAPLAGDIDCVNHPNRRTRDYFSKTSRYSALSLAACACHDRLWIKSTCTRLLSRQVSPIAELIESTSMSAQTPRPYPSTTFAMSGNLDAMTGKPAKAYSNSLFGKQR